MLLTTTLALLLGATAPVLCVRAETEAGLPVVLVDEVVPALRARIARKHMRVMACTNAVQPQWRLTVQRQGPKGLLLVIDGQKARRELEFEARGQSASEVGSELALKVAEAMRPSIDALLAELGLLEEPEKPTREPGEEALAQLALVAPDEPLAPSTPAGLVAQRLHVEAGVFGGVGDATPLLHAGAQLAVGLTFGSIRVSLVGAVLLPRRVTRDEVRLTSSQLDGGIGLDWAPGAFELGLRLLLRRALVGVSSDSATIDVGVQDYWAGVGALRVAWWPVRFGRLQLGGAVQGAAVWKPRVFLLRGQPVEVHSMVEGTLVLGLRFWLS